MIVDVGMLVGHVLDCEDSFLLSLVSQHCASNDVTDTIDVWSGCLQSVIDNDSSLLVELYSSFISVQLISVWSSSC